MRAEKKRDRARKALLGAFMVMSSSQAPSPGVREEAKRFKTATCSFSSQSRNLCWAARCKAPLARGCEAAQLPSKSDTLESDRLVAPVSFFRVKVNSAMAFALSMRPGVCGCVCVCVCVLHTPLPAQPTRAGMCATTCTLTN